MSSVEFRILPQVKPGGGRWKTLFEVERVHSPGNARTLEVIVMGWDPDRTFRISASFLPEEHRLRIKRGNHFLATINLGAKKSRGLRPTNFEALDRRELLRHIVDLL
ncbi:hypothetical protein HYZ06_02185 [Candidatus Daviesbacteria bacterium]|nr:hypothetical protein [Candidatus Daviesbacteria bacterium]